jgi:hypothetical protein
MKLYKKWDMMDVEFMSIRKKEEKKCDGVMVGVQCKCYRNIFMSIGAKEKGDGATVGWGGGLQCY